MIHPPLRYQGTSSFVLEEALQHYLRISPRRKYKSVIDDPFFSTQV